MGWDGRKSLKALILRAPLCGANKSEKKETIEMNISQGNKISPDTIATLFESLATVSFAQERY